MLIELREPTLRLTVLIFPAFEILKELSAAVYTLPVLNVFVLTFTVAIPPVGENPPAKFRVCAQMVVVDTFCEVKLLVIIEEV